MPQVNKLLSDALNGATEILVSIPGDPIDYKGTVEYNVTDMVNDQPVFYPIVIALENNPLDLMFEDAQISVNNGVIRVSDKGGRPIILVIKETNAP